MRLLSQPAISGDYRCVIEKMVEVRCKLTGIEISYYRSGRCVFFCCLSLLSLHHCCENKETKAKKMLNFRFRKPFCSSFSFFSSLGDTRDYISLQLIYCCCRSIRHFIQDRQVCKKLLSRSAGS